MTFRDYLKAANELAKKDPRTLDMKVVASADDEGNDFNEVHYKPAAGMLEDGGYFTTYAEDDQKNVVCIN